MASVKVNAKQTTSYQDLVEEARSRSESANVTMHEAAWTVVREMGRDATVDFYRRASDSSKQKAQDKSSDVLPSMGVKRAVFYELLFRCKNLPISDSPKTTTLS